MLIRTQDKEVLIDISGKRLNIFKGDNYYEINTIESLETNCTYTTAVILGCYPTKEKAQQVLNEIEIAWSKWVPGCSPAYHMPEANGVSDMSDVEKAEAIQKSKAMTPEVYGDGYDHDGNLIYDTWDCPRCGVSYEIDYDQYDYCPSCGQKIDWSEFKE